MKRFLLGLLLLFPVCAFAADKKNISMVTYFPVPYVAYSTVDVENNMDIGLDRNSGARLDLGNSKLLPPQSALNVAGYINVKNKLFLEPGTSEYKTAEVRHISLGDASSVANREVWWLFEKSLRANEVNAFGLSTDVANVDKLQLANKNFPSCYAANPDSGGKMYWTKVSITDKSADESLFLTCGRYAAPPEDTRKKCTKWDQEQNLRNVCGARKQIYDVDYLGERKTETAAECCTSCEEYGYYWSDISQQCVSFQLESTDSYWYRMTLADSSETEKYTVADYLMGAEGPGAQTPEDSWRASGSDACSMNFYNEQPAITPTPCGDDPCSSCTDDSPCNDLRCYQTGKWSDEPKWDYVIANHIKAVQTNIATGGQYSDKQGCVYTGCTYSNTGTNEYFGFSGDMTVDCKNGVNANYWVKTGSITMTCTNKKCSIYSNQQTGTFVVGGGEDEYTGPLINKTQLYRCVKKTYPYDE